MPGIKGDTFDRAFDKVPQAAGPVMKTSIDMKDLNPAGATRVYDLYLC
jgi:hypothetical protein